jgi:hypothetical protein
MQKIGLSFLKKCFIHEQCSVICRTRGLGAMLGQGLLSFSPTSPRRKASLFKLGQVSFDSWSFFLFLLILFFHVFSPLSIVFLKNIKDFSIKILNLFKNNCLFLSVYLSFYKKINPYPIRDR